jgi:hypothetical protein
VCEMPKHTDEQRAGSRDRVRNIHSVSGRAKPNVLLLVPYACESRRKFRQHSRGTFIPFESFQKLRTIIETKIHCLVGVDLVALRATFHDNRAAGRFSP